MKKTFITKRKTIKILQMKYEIKMKKINKKTNNNNNNFLKK